MAVKQMKAEKKVAYDQKLCQLLNECKNTMMKRSIRMHSEKTGNKAFLNLIPLLVVRAQIS
ncbi:ribosomal protein L10 family protein [Actinidia rufa]|uniref:Ribosomal protein L10 family protein n=1 Tax=Actinidia rufa TaxID=165716 RepID=A0A7J0EDR4_9ERIC|nr:ribosomal protein L10 family protein [Actinidia rufa]